MGLWGAEWEDFTDPTETEALVGGKVEARLSRKGWRGAARGGGEERALWLRPLPGDEGTPAASALGPLQVARYYA